MEDQDLEKTNSLFNLISHQPDIDKIYLHAKNSCEAKYQLLINKRKRSRLKHLYNSKAFIEYSNDMDDICNNVEEYNPKKERKILIVFDDKIDYMLSNKKLDSVVTDLFIRDRKPKIYLAFITQSYFCYTKKY